MRAHDKPSILNTVSCMDIFDLCDCLDGDSIDMILCDLPYGITACDWDTVIPFEPMWEAFKRIINPRGAIVLTASGKFTYKLVNSNMDMFKYEWVWDKYTATGGATAVYMPMKAHEIILLFSDGVTTYNPQMVDFTEAEKKRMRKHDFVCKGAAVGGGVNTSTGWFNGKQKNPKSIIRINGLTPVSKEKQESKHPTQKPVALFEYLIRTYTQPGNVVFDPCVGSGTTAIAARNTGRNFIVGDSSQEYVDIARARLAKPYTLPMFEEAPAKNEPTQTELI